MKSDDSLIWYASYGSNLSSDRFLCYIQGGQAEGSAIANPGCRDKTPPRASKQIVLPHKLYFAKVDEEWGNGGVAFIDPQKDDSASTLGRMHLITYDQFMDVIGQENLVAREGDFELGDVIRNGNLVIQREVWYGNIIFLGQREGYPVMTFTNERYLGDEINAPAEAYLRTIVEGLKGGYQLDDAALEKYLAKREGIRGWPIEKQLNRIIRNA